MAEVATKEAVRGAEVLTEAGEGFLAALAAEGAPPVWPPVDALDVDDGNVRLVIIAGPGGEMLFRSYGTTTLGAMAIAAHAPVALWQRVEAEMAAVVAALNPPPGEPVEVGK